MQVPGTHLSNASNHALPSANGSSASASATRVSVASATADRRYVTPGGVGAAPPIVVVSPDASGEDRLGGEPGGPITPPRLGARGLRPAPKDTIPISGKPPRKQRSSRFVVNEKVEIERLPAFSGSSGPFLHMFCSHFILRNPGERASSTIHQEVAPMRSRLRLQ